MAAMKAAEPDLSDEQHAKVTTLLVELTAYNVMRAAARVAGGAGAARVRQGVAGFFGGSRGHECARLRARRADDDCGSSWLSADWPDHDRPDANTSLNARPSRPPTPPRSSRRPKVWWPRGSAEPSERNPDVGIWVSRRDAGSWSTPVEVANGVQPNGTRQPSWNPVLFLPFNGPLVLFYKVGPSPSEWWGLARTSNDAGHTWSDAIPLPPGVLGPIRQSPWS